MRLDNFLKSCSSCTISATGTCCSSSPPSKSLSSSPSTTKVFNPIVAALVTPTKVVSCSSLLLDVDPRLNSAAYFLNFERGAEAHHLSSSVSPLCVLTSTGRNFAVCFLGGPRAVAERQQNSHNHDMRGGTPTMAIGPTRGL